MSAQGTPSVPPGWYPDPENPAQGRFWDGVAWTELRHQPGTPYPAAPSPKAPPGTDWNTPWIWLIALLPLLPTLLLLFVPWGSMFAIDIDDPRSAMSGTFALFLSPFYWGAIVLSYVVYGVSVFFAYRDVKELTARGVPQPFHWAFCFIGGVVYTIGRSVVVHRRTGNGHQPIWVEVAVFLVSIAISIAITVMIFDGMNRFLLENIPR
jgi:hypothetical protein